MAYRRFGLYLQVAVAGEASVPPPATARTANVFLPRSLRTFAGDSQTVKLAPFREHSKVAPDTADPNAIFGRFFLVFAFGAFVISVSGGSSSVPPKLALTVWSLFIATLHSPLPVQAPDQLLKVPLGTFGIAPSGTTVPDE